MTLHSNRPFLWLLSYLLFVVKSTSTLSICMWSPCINCLANTYNFTSHLLSSEATPTKWFCITAIHCNVQCIYWKSNCKCEQLIEAQVVATYLLVKIYLCELIAFCINCTIRTLQKKSAIQYCYQKGWYSVVVQTVVDYKYCCLDIYVGWPGSLHDSQVLSIVRHFTRNEQSSPVTIPIHRVNIPVFITGDSSYPMPPCFGEAI